ncbi:hypothetical protein D9M73_220220 [compost metagenome]
MVAAQRPHVIGLGDVEGSVRAVVQDDQDPDFLIVQISVERRRQQRLDAFFKALFLVMHRHNHSYHLQIPMAGFSMSTGVDDHWLQLFSREGDHLWRSTIDPLSCMKKGTAAAALCP